MSYCFNSTNSSIAQLFVCVHVHLELTKTTTAAKIRLAMIVCYIFLFVLRAAYESTICALTEQLCAKKEATEPANGSGSAEKKEMTVKLQTRPLLFSSVHFFMFTLCFSVFRLSFCLSPVRLSFFSSFFLVSRNCIKRFRKIRGHKINSLTF